MTASLFYELGEQMAMEVILHAPRRTAQHAAGDNATLQLDEDIAERLQFNS
eukprot:CAMPEP_0119368404 /NCGR_PEP_ID=MMETSP1334-20130426/15066_1 /TAXON_ID=127549 /ORGANISM="Calcidiscus leptoporus, Strain RCC1130" /LENGTH=50 /DNA_ID=CAMNT_0007385033 /DNA_START=15 /DNA_END=164 /DNA_ORIENTATION=+